MTTNLLQLPLNLTDPNAVALPVSTPDGPIVTWVDETTVELLAGRHLSRGSHGYAQVWHDGSMWPLHRLIMGCKIRDGRYVDHLNGDPLDNRRANLRIVTAQENSANRRCTSSTGYRGVKRAGNRFAAHGKLDGRAYYLGTYDTAEQAGLVAHLWRVKNLPGYLGRDITTVPAQRLAA